jgi:hypothetical protein
MRKFYAALLKNQESVSWPLLIACFGGGYLLATLLFNFFGGSIHSLLSALFY